MWSGQTWSMPLNSGSCVAEFTVGYFRGGLLWHVDLITDDKMSSSQMTRIGSPSFTSALNTVASRVLGGCARSHLRVVKECFRSVKPCEFSGGQLVSGCQGLLERMNVSFRLVLLAGKNWCKSGKRNDLKFYLDSGRECVNAADEPCLCWQARWNYQVIGIWCWSKLMRKFQRKPRLWLTRTHALFSLCWTTFLSVCQHTESPE